VYFLANDAVLDLTIAFLNSFRKYNPGIALCFVPYGSEDHHIHLLRQKYNFSVYPHAKVLEECDDMSARFHKTVCGAYRKLALWQGDFDEFIYIDVDTIILDNVEFVFKFLSDYEFITSHSNMKNILKWVWQKSIYASGHLTDEQIAYAANTGFIASRKTALPWENIKSALEDAVKLSGHMTLFCKEQPFLNYLIVTSQKKYTSLYVLMHQKNYQREIKLEAWAGGHFGIFRNGKIVAWLSRAPIFLLHWAGKWQPTAFDIKLFTFLRALGIKSSPPAIRFFMPYKRLWRYYRFMKAA
jgi:hypothetical protein